MPSRLASRVLMLTDDVFQLDRRIVQEANSLKAGLGASCSIFGVHAELPRPAGLPDEIEWLGATDAGELRGAAGSLRQATWRVARTLGLTGILQTVSCAVRDPGRRRVPVLLEALPGAWDLVVSHNLPTLALGLALREQGRTPRLVLDAHELFDEQHDSMSAGARRYWRELGDELVPRADAVFTVTPAIADELRKRHRLPTAPTVLYNACPHLPRATRSGLLRRLYGLSAQTRIVLCQGGLLPGRGLEDLADAARFLPDQVALVFLGTGPPRYLESLARRAGGRAFLGKSVDQGVLLAHTADADLGVISNRGPGLNNSLGGPNRLFEYLQARVPVLSFEHAGVREVLERAGTGWVITWRSPRELAAAVMSSLPEAAAIPEKRLEAAAELFSWEREQGKLLDLVSRTVGERPDCTVSARGGR
jgi:starch synthase